MLCETRATIRPHHLRTRSVTGSPRPFGKQTPGAQDYSPRVTERRNEVRDRRVTRNRPRCPATHGNNSGPHAARPRSRSSKTATATAAALEWAQAANRFAHGPRHATRGRAQAPRQASSRRAVDEEASSRQQQTEPAQASQHLRHKSRSKTSTGRRPLLRRRSGRARRRTIAEMRGDAARNAARWRGGRQPSDGPRRMPRRSYWN